jgi:23S rRNA (uracil1939-C5)-methyltransferase
MCPISSPLINRAIEGLWRWGRAGKIAVELREIELFANENDAQLQLEFYGDPRADKDKWTAAAQDLTERLRGEMPEVVSAAAFAQAFQAEHGKVNDSGEKAVWRFGEEFFYRSKARPLRVSAGSFFQVNRFLIDELVKTVAGGRSGEFALDLYAGVGLFSGALAASFRHIVAVESSHGSVKDLQYNSPENVKATRSTVEEFLTAKAGKIRPELVVADPPRAGLGERVARALGKLGAPRVIYISCDPATLARDLGTLIGSGYQVERMHLMDLFPQTYHIESVVELVR